MGHRNILSKCHTGDFFGEPYAASPGAVLNVSVMADTDCEIILLNVQRLLISCPTACEHHQKLIRNLVSVLANKILILNDKITHVGKRTTRDKLLSYLSAESIRHSSLSFDIPFDRQQLADYLCIDRAAMSTEISKLQKEGFIKTNRNHFEISAEEQEKKSHMYQNCSVEGVQVLLVEDNELNMEIAEFLLKEEKMIVTKAWNGREAVEIFENSESGYFDVILMDLMMPQMGGLEATRRIRKMDREDAKSIPVFAMKANAFLDDIAQSKAAGMNEHFSKPLQMEKVIDTIRFYCTAR